MQHITGGKMKIGVDAGCLGIKDSHLKLGVYQVAYNLFKQLKTLDFKNQYYLYTFYPIARKVMAEFGPNVTSKVLPTSRGWLYFGLPLQLLKDQVDLFVGLNQAVPALLPCPSIIYVYDLAFERYPEYFPDSYSKLHYLSQKAANLAIKIITISKSSKNDLVSLYQIKPAKITVAHCGYDHKLFIRQSTDKPQNYFLFVGALKRIKNVPTLLQAFAQFQKESPVPYKLILAGSKRWVDPQIKATIKELKLQNDVQITGYISNSRLTELYQHAAAFVLPSLYEGFGIPLLEAMASGCPVIASKVASIPEVVGDCGILIDPQSPQQITQALLDLTQNPKLRQKLIASGLKRVQAFSWRQFAAKFTQTISTFN